MSLAIKHGVRIHGIRPEVVLAAFIVEGTMREAGYATTITSCVDGSHSNASLHYTGSALDIRTRDIPADKLELLRTSIADRLGMDFDFILEADHFHLEWQPKKPLGATA